MITILAQISIKRGDSYPLGIRLRDNSNSNYLDITGYTFLLTVDTRQDPDDTSTQVFQLVGLVDPDQVANAGCVSFLPSITDTDKDPAVYYYDIQMVYGPGSAYVRTIAKDKFSIIMDITK